MHDWYMDPRHVEMVRAELATRKYRRVLEIGAFHGFSTRAFVDALVDGDVQEVHVCELTPTPALTALLHGTGITLHAVKSVALLKRDADWDFVLVDGDHTLLNCKAEAELLLGVPCIAAHDVCAEYIQGCEGPAYMMRFLASRGYDVTVDSEDRPGERTWRGLMIARKQ